MLIDDLLSLIRERRSVREFTAEAVSAEEIRLLIEAARHAPSNGNRQAWKFLAVKNKEKMAQMGAAVQAKLQLIRNRISDPEQLAMFDSYSRYLTFFSAAPLLIVALYKKAPQFLEPLLQGILPPSGGDFIPPEGFSIAMAVQNLLLAAQALGLGACCTTGPLVAGGELGPILGIPPSWIIAALVPVGRFARLPVAPPKKGVEQILEVRE